MSGLVLKLGPNERVLINGAVIENGSRRSRLNIVTPGANILRLRDAIHPDQTDTPVRRLCYVAQLVLSGDRKMEDVRPRLSSDLERLSNAMTDSESQRLIRSVEAAVDEGKPYYILKFLRALLPREAAMLGVSPP